MKITRKISVGSYLKEQERLKKLAQQAKENEKTQKIFQRAAKSILDARAKYSLQVNTKDVYSSSSINNVPLAYTNSLWAPWSRIAK